LNQQQLLRLLEEVADGHRAPAEAAVQLGSFGSAAVIGATGQAEARVDHQRAMRCGFPEVVFAEGKTPEQVGLIAREILQASAVVIATRATPEHHQAVVAHESDARWFEAARLIAVDRRETRPADGHIVVASAGTSDIPIAEEAAICAELMGSRVTRLYDMGVAGLHRLLDEAGTLRSARAVIAVAGMEGALPSVIAGIVDIPVVAVPTSIGYGANFGGVSALLSMLNSCAGGISVVNIDNGFGAAVVATRINRPAWERGQR